MPTYIADRYAGILTKEDVGQLFDALTEKLHGNRSEAARQCGLTGKATYDWERAGYVKLTTKRKVLETCLRMDFLGTVEYLLKRSSERTVDVLRTILSTIYAETIETNSKEQFITLLDKFDTLRIEYRGLITDRIMDEVADMLWMLRQKAQELKVPAPPKSIEDISAKELLGVFPLIGDMYLSNPQGPLSIARTLDLPLESIEMLWPTFEKLHPVRESITEAETIPPAVGLIQVGEIGIRLGIGAPMHDRADLRVEVKFRRGMEPARAVATSSEIYTEVVGEQSVANPSDLQRAMTQRRVVR